jgi:hypothetical protein
MITLTDLWGTTQENLKSDTQSVNNQTFSKENSRLNHAFDGRQIGSPLISPDLGKSPTPAQLKTARGELLAL